MAQFGAIGYLNDVARLGYVIFNGRLYVVNTGDAVIINYVLQSGDAIHTEERERDPSVHVYIPQDRVYDDDEDPNFWVPRPDIHIVLRSARYFNMSADSRRAMRHEFRRLLNDARGDAAKNIRNTLADAGIQV